MASMDKVDIAADGGIVDIEDLVAREGEKVFDAGFHQGVNKVLGGSCSHVDSPLSKVDLPYFDKAAFGGRLLCGQTGVGALNTFCNRSTGFSGAADDAHEILGQYHVAAKVAGALAGIFGGAEGGVVADIAQFIGEPVEVESTHIAADNGAASAGVTAAKKDLGIDPVGTRCELHQCA